VKCWTHSGVASVAAMVLATASASVLAKGGFVAAGVGFAPDYEGGDDYAAFPNLLGRYNFATGRFVALVDGVDAARSWQLVMNLVPNSPWQFGPALGFRYERNDPDNDHVKRMDDIDWAIEAGGFIKYNGTSWFSALGVLADVSDTHGGYIADLQAGYKQEVTSDFGLIYTASIAYANDEYMQEYFGVDGSDASSSGLPLYDADGGFKDYGLGISANYKFTNSWGLIAGFTYHRMLGDAEDSPLVNDEGDKNQYKASVAVSYSF
jgi:outer membrane protein